MKVWLDDVRDPNEHGHIGWFWVKTYEHFIVLLKDGKVNACSLDHDLGVYHTLGLQDPEKTGYDVICFMEEHSLWPEFVTVHSQNPVGKHRMERVLSANYIKKDTIQVGRNRTTTFSCPRKTNNEQ